MGSKKVSVYTVSKYRELKVLTPVIYMVTFTVLYIIVID